ncbi:hypothetical protein KHA80_00560 [Anaerobacillus sp. HL2]|nr:hypothetical protein KHA80_00560 [Anaerobacillus sp. HL2]
MRKIEELDGRGKYRIYEALDFTQERLPKEKKHKVIRSYMAHHQGMSMLTLSNLLLPKKTMYDRFHRNKQVRSAELLLQKSGYQSVKIKHPAIERIHKP